jgi:acetolactate synthase I/II/III large subunit
MSEITGGELLLKCLKMEGTRWIFAISDAFYNPLTGKLRDNDITLIVPRHEAAAVHMAEAVYKTAGQVPVVMAGAGPGSANMASGLINAAQEGVPLIAISAQLRVGNSYPFKPGAYQGIDHYTIFKSITKWNAVVHQWERIPEIVQRAFREALAGRPGPVHIDIPVTIFYEKGDETRVKILESFRYRQTVPEPSADQLESAAGIIAKSKNPVIIAGSGILYSNGTGELTELADLLKCPVITTAAARSVISNDHPSYLMAYSSGALAARKEADLILVLGSRLGDMDLPFDKYFGDHRNQMIIQVDVDPLSIGANRPITLGIVADARKTMRGLVDSLTMMGTAHTGNAGKYKKMDDEWNKTLTDFINSANEESMIHPAQSIKAVTEIFPPDSSINVGDGGNTSLFNAFIARFTRPRTSLGIFEFGHLGTGIPYAIGAKIANPHKDVYCITGDGAAGFNFMEMETAVREKIKITVIVHADESWCMEEIAQMMEGGNESTFVGVRQNPTRWDKVAEGMGCHGEYVDRPEDLHNAIQRAKDSKLPAVVCVKTNRKANLLPPEIEKFLQVYEGTEGGLPG